MEEDRRLRIEAREGADYTDLRMSEKLLLGYVDGILSGLAVCERNGSGYWRPCCHAQRAESTLQLLAQGQFRNMLS